jgi:predicted metalloprotease with PDZ domain
MNRALLVPALALTLAALPAAGLHGAPMPAPISYILRFPAPETHYVEVEALVPTDGRAAIELVMPVWTPGSYLVREFSRHLEEVAAATESGTPLAIAKTRKNRWRVTTEGAPRVVVRYRVYAREMGVRTNFVDAGFAILNGAPTFLTLAGDGPRPHDVEVVPPPQWKVVVSPLPPAPGAATPSGAAHRFRAADFDTLVDSPLYAGNATVHSFEVAGKPHLLVNEGEDPAVWDGPRSAAEAERLVREEIAFWGFAPYARYVFFNLMTEAGGGLEHKDSTLLMTSRWRQRTREGHLDWLSLVSHEFFHAWNVKRLRPVELGPFDYENEVYTRSLWVAEGITSYYDELLVRRAGLATQKEYLKRLGKQIEGLESAPGRLVQPLAAASFDAWIKQYRPDENSENSTVDYYTKGAVVGFLLDARIRRATGGARSLDDALRLLYQRYAGAHGFTPEQFRATVAEVAATDLGGWFRRAVDTAGPLDYSEALDWYGLRFGKGDDKAEEDEEEGEDDGGGRKDEEPAGWLGVDTALQGGRLVVTKVKRGTPGFAAGVSVDDEILAIGDYRVPPDGWKKRLKAYRPGEPASLLVARRERLLRLPVVFGEKPRSRKLEVAPGATPEQKARLAAWLG